MQHQQQPDQPFSGRVPPQNMEAEQSVLGACLVDREAITKVRTLVRPEDFYATKHELIFRAILLAADAGGADLITVQDQLRRPAQGSEQLLIDQVGGLAYLTGLINTVPTTANVELYAEIVGQKAKLRRIQDAARRTVDDCYEADNPAGVLGDLQQSIDKEARGTARMGLKSIAGRIGSYARQRYEQRNLPNADWIPSRFPEIREKCPYMRGEVTLLAMPPGTGKTTVAVNEADFLTEVGYRVAFFELEMREQQLYDKFIAMRARMELKPIRMGLLDGMEWIFYLQRGEELDQRTNLSINTETEETMSSIRWQCLRYQADGGLDMVIIDFLDRVSEKGENREERYDQLVARIAGIGQKIARECNCHVMILAQIDVKVYHRPNPVPTLADLANSKTNLSAWPDNVITGIQPGKARGDGRSKPAVMGLACADKRWRNTLVLSIAKGRFSDDAMVPVYAEMKTGFLGSLAHPWPWRIKCIPAGKDKPHPPSDECPKGKDHCEYNHVGQWDKGADDAHKAAMQAFRERAQSAAVSGEEWF